MIRENDDGTFTVTLRRYDHSRRRYVDDEVTVDRDLYRHRGDVLGTGSHDRKKVLSFELGRCVSMLEHLERAEIPKWELLLKQ